MFRAGENCGAGLMTPVDGHGKVGPTQRRRLVVVWLTLMLWVPLRVATALLVSPL